MARSPFVTMLLAGLLAGFAAFAAGCESDNGPPLSATSTAPAAETPTSVPSTGEVVTPEPELKVAFIGDSGNGEGFRNVLRLIEQEEAALVLHQGDFDYDDDPQAFFATIDSVLGPDFPYLASVGNHDRARWPEDCGGNRGCYASLLKRRMERSGLTPDDADLDDEMYAVQYRGLSMVFVGEDGSNADDCDDDPDGYACFIRRSFQGDGHIWKICSWHKNQQAAQVGGKDDEMGWDVYEACREAGAIIATGHEHSYSRTKTLTSIRERTVDVEQHPPVDGVPGRPDRVEVQPGATFLFVSGLGGRGMRDQERCRPIDYPYGCNEWASIYTTDQTGGEESFGALFIEFHVDGDPYRAHGYFKTADGEVIDDFEIIAARGEAR